MPYKVLRKCRRSASCIGTDFIQQWGAYVKTPKFISLPMIYLPSCKLHTGVSYDLPDLSTGVTSSYNKLKIF